MKIIEAKFNGFDGRGTIVVHVKPTRNFLVRKWLALQFIWLASRLVGAGFEVEEDEE